MAHLHVSVRLHGLVVDQRLCAVGDEVWLGEADEAEVAFPGANVRVRRFGERLQLQGVWLKPGHPVWLRRGPVDVEIEAVVPKPMPRPLEWAPDLRLLLATAAVVLFGASWEAASAFVHDNATLLAHVVGDGAVQVVVGPPVVAIEEDVTATAGAEPVGPHSEDDAPALPDVVVQTLPPTVRWRAD